MVNQDVATVVAHSNMEWWPLLLLLGVLGSIGWVIIAAGTVMEKGEGMDRSERIAQLYGYTVCLIAIVVFIASANSFVQSAFEYANPFSGNPWSYGAGQVLTSFDSYKATYDLTLPGQKPVPAISDAEMHARYDALRADRISTARFEAVKSMTVSGILIVIAILLFIVHWRWLQSRATLRPSP
jgi:hypothetical protein